MPHSHIDAGWIFNMEEVYKTDGEKIITGVTNALFDDEYLRFNFADIAFLERWWRD